MDEWVKETEKHGKQLGQLWLFGVGVICILVFAIALLNILLVVAPFALEGLIFAMVLGGLIIVPILLGLFLVPKSIRKELGCEV